jgi:NADH:ubiquinone oxidoreductase subunit K
LEALILSALLTIIVLVEQYREIKNLESVLESKEQMLAAYNELMKEYREYIKELEGQIYDR